VDSHIEADLGELVLMTVGMHPSIGLAAVTGSSRSRTRPTHPARSRAVTDAAILLTAISGVDPNDPMTADAAALDGTDFTTFLDKTAIDGQA
jgi:amidase